MSQQGQEKCKGLIVEVFRAADGRDCTNGGITSRVTEVLLVAEGIDGVFEEREGRPTLELVRRTIFGKPYVHAQPVTPPGSPRRHYMFGGNFLYTSDSRFPHPYPVAVHDRVE